MFEKIIFSAVFCPITILAQGVFGPDKSVFTVKDCYKKFHCDTGLYLRVFQPNILMKGERVWRIIGMENNENKEVFISGNKCVDVGLFEVIKFGLLDLGLNAFLSENFKESQRVGKSELLPVLSYIDTSKVTVFDSKGEAIESIEIKKGYFNSSDIQTYIVMEDWIFNSRKGVTEKIMVAIAPVVQDKKLDKMRILFWLYFPEWQHLFSCFEAKNYYSHTSVSYREIFEKKLFLSRVTKTSNVFDRKLNKVFHGEDLQLESERIKEKSAQAESDLFEY